MCMIQNKSDSVLGGAMGMQNNIQTLQFIDWFAKLLNGVSHAILMMISHHIARRDRIGRQEKTA